MTFCLPAGLPVLGVQGAKNARQVEEAAGALGWRLSDAQVAELDAVSAKVPSSTGAPFEAW
jgi:aryl-alcohol dehydrogenase-like predicted oxidoreductase